MTNNNVSDQAEQNGHSKLSTPLIANKNTEEKDAPTENSEAQTGKVNVLMVLIRAFGFKFATRQVRELSIR